MTGFSFGIRSLFLTCQKNSAAPCKTEACDKFSSRKLKIRRSSVDLVTRLETLNVSPVHVYLLRKEVIQPQVPLRLPCYDFIPITSHTFGHCFLAVCLWTSGTTGFHDVTGG